MTAPAEPTAATRIDAATQVGLLALTVADLARSLDYYERAIGLRVLERRDGRASLGGDEELLAAARQYEGYLAQETLALRVGYEAAANGAEATIEGRPLRVEVRRA